MKFTIKNYSQSWRLSRSGSITYWTRGSRLQYIPTIKTCRTFSQQKFGTKDRSGRHKGWWIIILRCYTAQEKEEENQMHWVDSRSTVLRRELSIASSRYWNLNTSKYHSYTRMMKMKVTFRNLNQQIKTGSGLNDCRPKIYYQPKYQG